MSEKFPKEEAEKATMEAFDFLAEMALDCGLKAKLPQKGSVEWHRLYQLCRNYSDAVHKDVTGIVSFEISGRERRKFHNEPLKMLFGTDYDNTSAKNIVDTASFAHMVAGREQYTT
jgi:hypothetical protein